MHRCTKTKLLQLALVGLIGVLIAVFWRPIEVHYYLYQLRREERPARAAINPLCEFGDDARGPLIDVAHAYAGESGFFRLAAFQTFVCLREVTLVDDPAPFPAPDEEAIDAMRSLFEEEPSEAHRHYLEQVAAGLDEWSRLLFWESVALSGGSEDERPAPPFQLVSHCQTMMSWCGTGMLMNAPRRYEAEWCANVGPVLTRWLLEGMAGISDFAIIQRLSEHECLDTAAAAVALQTRHEELSGDEVDVLLTCAYADPSAQATLIGELIRSSAGCEHQRRLHRGLEVRRPHVAATEDLLAEWVTSISAECLGELFASTPPHERRARMFRSLGISSE